jgi:hypothetical protein
MTDLLQATAEGVFAALDLPAVTSLAPVYTTVPKGAQPPYIEIGAIDAENDGPKDGGLENLSFEIEYHHRGPSRWPLLAMMHAARTALEAADIEATGAAFSDVRWLASATDREDDGVTHHGIHRFELHAQPTED